MRERDMKTAKFFGVYDRVEELEKKLLEIDRVVDVEFDLDGFYDNIRQVIIIPKYDIPADIDNYWDVRRNTLNEILEVASSFGLSKSGDQIEDMGAHWYIVRSCDNSWVIKDFESVAKDLQNATALEYKGIVFDNFEIDFENKSVWAEMCQCCADKYKDLLSDELSEGGVGSCGVQGCDVVGMDSDNETHYYVDFKLELIQTIDMVIDARDNVDELLDNATQRSNEISGIDTKNQVEYEKE